MKNSRDVLRVPCTPPSCSGGWPKKPSRRATTSSRERWSPLLMSASMAALASNDRRSASSRGRRASPQWPLQDCGWIDGIVAGGSPPRFAHCAVRPSGKDSDAARRSSCPRRAALKGDSPTFEALRASVPSVCSPARSTSGDRPSGSCFPRLS